MRLPFVSRGLYAAACKEIEALERQLGISQGAVMELRRRMHRRPRKAAGVVVTTLAGADEYSEGQRWHLDRVQGTDQAWLHIHDLQGERIATYAPGTFARVEHGRADEIKEETTKPEAK